jgi:hypothetical protein
MLDVERKVKIMLHDRKDTNDSSKMLNVTKDEENVYLHDTGLFKEEKSEDFINSDSHNCSQTNQASHQV